MGKHRVRSNFGGNDLFSWTLGTWKLQHPHLSSCLVWCRVFEVCPVLSCIASLACFVVVFADTVLCVLWVLLAAGGIIFQLYRERGRPHFPPHPYFKLKKQEQQRRNVAINAPLEDGDATEENERSPLLQDVRQQAPSQRLPRQRVAGSREDIPTEESPTGSRVEATVVEPL